MKRKKDLGVLLENNKREPVVCIYSFTVIVDIGVAVVGLLSSCVDALLCFCARNSAYILHCKQSLAQPITNPANPPIIPMVTEADRVD